MTTKRIAAKILEADVVRSCVDFLEARGWRAIRQGRAVAKFGHRGTVTFGEPGMPDYLFHRYSQRPMDGPERILWIEFKSPNDRRQCICRTKMARKRCTVCDQNTWRVNEQVRGATVLRIESLEQLKASSAWK